MWRRLHKVLKLMKLIDNFSSTKTWHASRQLLTYVLTYLLAYFMEHSPSEKQTGLQLVNKFPAFNGTRKFITALTSARHLSVCIAISIQSIPSHPTSWRSALLSSHLRLALPNGLFPSGFPTNILYMPFHSPLRVTCPTQLILIYLITRKIVGEEYRSLKMAGSNPAEAVGFFGRKNPQSAFLRRGSKAVCPMSQICGM
jgi:hypothetical protein